MKGNHVVPMSLDNVRKNVLEFNEKSFGNIFKHKRNLESQLKGIQLVLESCDDLRPTLLEAEIQKEYQDVLKQEELF